MLPLYIYRASPIHAASPVAKLVLVIAASTVICFLPLWPLTAALATVLALYRLALLPLRAMATALRPVLIVAAILFALQWVFAGFAVATLVTLRLIALVLLTSLVTLTTPLADMLDVLIAAARPFARLGISPPKMALAVALTIRFIPTLLNDWQEIQRARIARGGSGYSVYALGPLIIKVLHMTNALGNAIAARGFESRK